MVRLTLTSNFYNRFFTDGFTTEPDGREWQSHLIVLLPDGQVDLYATPIDPEDNLEDNLNAETGGQP